MDSEPRDANVDSLPHCLMCGAALPANALMCPVCGESRPHVGVIPKVPPPGRTRDIVFAVVTALLAGLLTMPFNFAMTQELLNAPDPVLGLIVGVWNTLVWGAPIAVVGRWWYVGAKRGDPDKSYLWRIYWKAQVGTFGVLTALTILLLTICAAAL
jgi:hypothetical protein